MKFTATHYGQTVSVEVPADDLTLDQARSLLVTLLLALGYDREQVHEAIGEPTLPEA